MARAADALCCSASSGLFPGDAACPEPRERSVDKKTGKLYLDGDGAGGDAEFPFAKLKTDTKLHADDLYSGSSMVV